MYYYYCYYYYCVCSYLYNVTARFFTFLDDLSWQQITLCLDGSQEVAVGAAGDFLDVLV